MNKTYWYFSRSGRFPRQPSIVQTYLCGAMGTLIEARKSVFSDETMQQFGISFLGHMNIRQIIGTRLFQAAGVNTNRYEGMEHSIKRSYMK